MRVSRLKNAKRSVYFARKYAFEFFCRESKVELTPNGNADTSGLFAHYNGYSIAVLTDTHGRTMTQVPWGYQDCGLLAGYSPQL